MNLWVDTLENFVWPQKYFSHLKYISHLTCPGALQHYLWILIHFVENSFNKTKLVLKGPNLWSENSGMVIIIYDIRFLTISWKLPNYSDNFNPFHTISWPFQTISWLFQTISSRFPDHFRPFPDHFLSISGHFRMSDYEYDWYPRARDAKSNWNSTDAKFFLYFLKKN